MPTPLLPVDARNVSHAHCTLLPGFLGRGCLGKPFLVPLVLGLFFLKALFTQLESPGGLTAASGLLLVSFTVARGTELWGFREARGTWGCAEPGSSATG